MKAKSIINGILKNGLPYSLSTKLYKPPLVTEGQPPILFNNRGMRVLLAYMQDVHIRHSPYTLVSGRIPERILWDHYNNGLNTQFYTHKEILRRIPISGGQRQFGLLLESENIVNGDYETLLSKQDTVSELAGLFTHSQKLLDKYENAFFIPGGGVWYGTALHGGILDCMSFEKKTKLLSIVSSTKKSCALHQFRIDLAKEIMRKDIGDVMGTIVGKYVNIADSLTDYMYSISIENAQTNYYFTEKILNCFASMTIPVYYGAKKIDDFFNEDGIIHIKKPTIECAIETIKKECTIDGYQSRIEAIKDNYSRVQKYLCIEDYIMDNYEEQFVY